MRCGGIRDYSSSLSSLSSGSSPLDSPSFACVEVLAGSFIVRKSPHD